MKRTLSVVLAAILAVLAAALVPTPASGAPASSSSASQPPSVDGQLLVGYERGTSSQERADARARAGTRLVERVVAERGDRTTVELVQAVNGTTREQAMHRFTSNPTVRFAEPNWIYHHETTAAPNDTYVANGSLWGMYGDASTPANQYGSQAAEAWAAATSEAAVGSSDVYVGVIDEGIQYTHPDLAGQVWTNPYDADGDGVDNDSNGYVDDVHGWDFAGGNNTVYDGGTSGNVDDHGTHVSGTIGANANNGVGVAGMNWHISLISAKFLGANGGTTANAIKAVDYITDLKTRHGLNIVATNNSWGGGGFSQGLSDAITRGGAANILFIAAAGNGGSDGVGDNNDTTANYPSNYTCDCVIAVAAITNSGAKASFSNYGATTVDLGAPGSGIWSTTAYNTYSSYSGTSMATPHVTGAAALYASAHPNATAAQIKAAILDSTVPTTSLSGKTVTGGRLNVSGFLGTVAVTPTPPTAPQNLIARGGDTKVGLTWDPPASSGSSAITGYEVQRADLAQPFAVSGAVTSYIDRTALNGTTYTYTVRAVNDAGAGAWSTSAQATPTPRAVTVTMGAKKRNQTSVTVTWVGFIGGNVDVTRAGATISTTNDGSLTENWRSAGPYSYTVCETGTSFCATGSSG